MSDVTTPAEPRPVRPRRAQRVGIAEVAKRAGVSQGTVSNVLNHPDRVTSRTRERVEAAIAELDFVPNTSARSLAAGSTRALGLILSDLTNSLFVDVGRGVERVAAEHGAFVLMANSDTDLDRERQYLAMFDASQAMGTLVTINDATHYRTLVEHHRPDRPLVFLNYRGDSPTHCMVDMDNRRGGEMAAEHLVATGRRRLALVAGPMHLQPVAERVAGFVGRASSLGVPVETIPIEEVTRSAGFAAGGALLPRIEAGECDGVFAIADLVAAGVAQALAVSRTVSVPRDVGIVGYDDNRAAWDSPLPLTTLRQPGEAMGAAGATLAFEELEDASHVHRAVTLEPELVVRRSTVGDPRD